MLISSVFRGFFIFGYCALLRISDPTPAGDFCHRFTSADDVNTLQKTLAETRHEGWKRQPSEFFEQATIDMDGPIVETTGECKEVKDISYNGE